MSLSVLIAAIEYLEAQERGRFPQPSPPSDVQVQLTPGPVGYGLDSGFSSGWSSSSASPQTPPISIQGQICPKMMKMMIAPPTLPPSKMEEDLDAKRRRVHNTLEKGRRAQIRERLHFLKTLLPVPTSHNGAPYARLLTTSATLKRSIIYIQRLEKEEKEYLKEVERLQDLKGEMERKLEVLREEMKSEEEGNLYKMEEKVEQTETQVNSKPPIVIEIPSSSSPPRMDLDLPRMLSESRQVFGNNRLSETASVYSHKNLIVISIPQKKTCGEMREGDQFNFSGYL